MKLVYLLLLNVSVPIATVQQIRRAYCKKLLSKTSVYKLMPNVNVVRSIAISFTVEIKRPIYPACQGRQNVPSTLTGQFKKRGMKPDAHYKYYNPAQSLTTSLFAPKEKQIVKLTKTWSNRLQKPTFLKTK